MSLTRKDQVLTVLQAGGWATTEIRDVGFGLAHLFDSAGEPVPAWQTAIVSNLKPRCFNVARHDGKNIWVLKS